MVVSLLHQHGHWGSLTTRAQQVVLGSTYFFNLIMKFIELLFWDSLTKTFLFNENISEKIKPWNYIAIFYNRLTIQKRLCHIEKKYKYKNILIFSSLLYIFWNKEMYYKRPLNISTWKKNKSSKILCLNPV